MTIIQSVQVHILWVILKVRCYADARISKQESVTRQSISFKDGDSQNSFFKPFKNMK